MKQSSGYLGTAIKILLVIVLVAVLGGIGYGVWGYFNATSQGTTFKTEKAFKGPLVATVSSTGTIEPEEVIDIGAQINGQVIRFGPDLEAIRSNLDLATAVGGPVLRSDAELDVGRLTQIADKLNSPPPTLSYSPGGTKPGPQLPMNRNARFIDWRTNVEAGDILAQLDDSLYRAIVAEKQAAVTSAKADLESKLAAKNQADREWTRAEALKPGGGISLTEYDTAKMNHEATTANVGVSKAAIGLAQAQLDEAKVNLGYTTIKSPVKGVIIDRRVNVGQTVVAGLSAPSLFLLAKDLTRVQVWVAVNEADVGSIKNGQEATFTVDTYPGEVFKGIVTKVRLNATMTQNVVTYPVEVTTINPVSKEHPDGQLLPYLTANVKFIIDKKDVAQLVPNSALWWRPPAGGINQVHPDFRHDYEMSLKRKAAPDDSGQSSDAANNKQNHGTVWVEKDGFARPVKVLTGKTDNINTEIIKVLDKDPQILDFDAGSPLIVGEGQTGPTGTVNPFAPKLFSGKKQ